MSLINFIEKIQQKPRHIRVQILWMSVFVCMLIIISLWVVSFNYDNTLSNENQKASISGEINQSLERAKKEIPSLKEAIKDSVSVFFEKGLDEELEQLETPSELNESENIFIKTKRVKPNKLPLSD
ncbi:hypothetical protein KKE74_00155 [Patescibacteria group bacterium]|nr:hypothetical protein [Patescibacteria group bacterium]MBU2472429.1 hypothetical protein [Patescibacteria group bacterium]